MKFLLLFACAAPAETGGRQERALLVTAAELDSRTLAVLREAEAAVTRGDRARAVARIREGALPAADRAVSHAEGLAPRTASGRAAKDELLAVLTLRREAIDLYLEAVESRDDFKMLDALRKSREIELALVAWEREAVKVGRATERDGCGS